MLITTGIVSSIDGLPSSIASSPPNSLITYKERLSFHSSCTVGLLPPLLLLVVKQDRGQMYHHKDGQAGMDHHIIISSSMMKWKDLTFESDGDIYWSFWYSCYHNRLRRNVKRRQMIEKEIESDGSNRCFLSFFPLYTCIFTFFLFLRSLSYGTSPHLPATASTLSCLFTNGWARRGRSLLCAVCNLHSCLIKVKTLSAHPHDAP